MARQRYRALLAYDGTAYQGFQRQAGDTPTVQGAVEAALRRVTGEATSLTGAGRTDSGVHATGQVIAFEAAWRHPTAALLRAVNANVPDDIALLALDEARADFHPRFDARSRTYRYTLYTAPVRQPHLNNRAWHAAPRPLDLDAMQAAAALLLGTHDFATFGQPPQGDNTVRELLRSAFAVLDEHVGGETGPDTVIIRYTVEANAFLYRMVRRIVGALVRVGRGQVTRDEFAAVFRAADGSWPNQTAPAHGLCLTKVTYQ
jgi:tRNA pseudouridine38-40 synthase